MLEGIALPAACWLF